MDRIIQMQKEKRALQQRVVPARVPSPARGARPMAQPTASAQTRSGSYRAVTSTTYSQVEVRREIVAKSQSDKLDKLQQTLEMQEEILRQLAGTAAPCTCNIM